MIKFRKICVAMAAVMMLGLCVGCGESSSDSASTDSTADSADDAADSTDDAADASADSEDAADSTDGETTAAADDGELTEITFVLDWTPNTNHTGLYVADSLGYYAEEGIKINIVQPSEDGAVMMVASGDGQFGIDFQDYLVPVFASEEEIPVTAVAAILQHNTSGIISLAENEITSPAKMEGKNYATWSLDIEQAMLKNVIEADGGDFSKVNLIPEYVTDEAAALQQDIDCIWVYYGWAGIATELAGLGTNIFYFKDITPEFDYYSPVIIANDDFLSESPEVAKAFLRATAKGYEYAIENPDAAADILCEAVPELDSELVHASQTWMADQYKAEEDRWGYIDQERWDAFYAWVYENGLSTEIAAGDGFTNDYLPE